MTTQDDTLKQKQDVDALITNVAQTLAQEGGGTIDQRIALAHALASARIATALESIDYYGLEATMLRSVDINVPDPITVYSR